VGTRAGEKWYAHLIQTKGNDKEYNKWKASGYSGRAPSPVGLLRNGVDAWSIKQNYARGAHISYLLSQHSPKLEGSPSVCEPGTLALELVKEKEKRTTCEKQSEHQLSHRAVIAGHLFPYILLPQTNSVALLT
jgi:hypothetical protein